MSDQTRRVQPEPSDDRPDEPAAAAPAGGEAGGDLAWLNPPARPVREAIVSMRMTEDERDRISRAAEVAGVTASAYARSRVLGPGPDVMGWRAVYTLIQQHSAAIERGDDPAESARQLERGFREVALTVFPEASDS